MDYEEFQSAAWESVAWRKHELQQARYLAQNATEVNLPYLCRAWTLVMYAHCDQFTKELSRLYLEFIKNNPSESYDYWSIWQAFRAKKLMLEGADGQNYESALRPRQNDKSKLIDVIAHKTVLDSGNFSYKRLRFIVNFVLQIDFDCASYKGFCMTLKAKRDEIAHGEKSLIAEVDDCVNWHEPTLMLLDSVLDCVLDKASQA